MSHDLDFLKQELPATKQKIHHSRRPLIIGFSVVLATVGIFIIWTGVNAGFLATSLFDGRENLMAAKVAVEDFSFDEAQESLNKAEVNFSDAQKYLRRIGFFKVLPGVGPQILAVQTLLDSSSELFEIVNKIITLGADIARLVGETKVTLAGTEEIMPLKYDELSPETKRIVLQRLNGAASDLALVAEQAGLIKKDLESLQQISEPLGSVIRKLDFMLSEVYQVLTMASVGSRIMPTFTGLGGEKRFLLLLENNTEMRPAGGFIGTYGILRVKDGEITELELKDSYLLDQAVGAIWSAEPPAPLQKYLAAEKWFFRDSNWSPDFSVSARNAISMFTNEVLSIPVEQRSAIQEPISFDGVIALTPTFVSDLLKITGPITVGDQNFSSDNIIDALEYQVEKKFQENGVPYNQRKDIITVLLNEIKTKIFNLSFDKWLPVFVTIEKNLSNKQIVLFDSSSSETEVTIQKAGWGGIVENNNNDFLMVVNANLASLKTDLKILQNVSYSIQPTGDGRFIGKTTIRYDHQGQFDWKTTRYRTYTRLYVPLGSELIRGSGMLVDDKLKNPSGAVGTIDVNQELGLTVFGAFISIEPGESGELSFEYYLPTLVENQIESGDYSLQVVKQIGAPELNLTTELNFDKKVTSASPAEIYNFWGDAIYSSAFGLEKDLLINVVFD